MSKMLTRRHEDTKSPSVEELSALVVDTAFHIHKELGAGMLESVYQKVLAAVLRKRGLSIETEIPVTFIYDGIKFEEDIRIDLLVNEMLVVELKSVEQLAPVHHKQLLTYLRLTRLPLGLLINFGGATFKEGCRRIVNGKVDTTGSMLRVNR